MRRVTTAFLVLGFATLVWASSTFAAETETLPTDLSAKGFLGFVFSGQKVKDSIDEKLVGFQYVSMGFGFLLLVFPSVNGLIRRGLGPESIARYVTKPIMLCGFIAIVPEVQRVVSAGFDGLAGIVAYSPSTTIDNYYAEMKVFDMKGAASALRPDSAVLVESTMLDKMGSTLSALRDLSRWYVQASVTVPTALLFELLSYATMMSIFVSELVRHVLLSVGYALLPAFIAGFNSELFQRSAYRYAMRMVGLHLWPVAWGLIGAMTLALTHLLRVYVDALFTTAAIDPGGEFGMVELLAVTPTVVVFTLVLATIVITGGHIYGLMKIPAVLTKLLTEGGDAIEGTFERLRSEANQTVTVNNSSTLSGGTTAGSAAGSVLAVGPALQTLAAANRSGSSSRHAQSAGEMNEVFGMAGQRALELARGAGRKA